MLRNESLFLRNFEPNVRDATGQFIDLNGTLGATGGYLISGGAGGDYACVIGIDATHWEALPTVGSWTLD